MRSLTNHTKVLIAFVPVLLVVAFAGAVYLIPKSANSPAVVGTPNVSGSPQTAQLKPASASGQLAQEFKTVAELVGGSQVIVVGQFEGEPNIVPPNLPPNGTEPYDPGRRELTFQVTSTLKGETKTATIKVAQRVGFPTADSKAIVALDDDTLFKAGDAYILFLNKTLHEQEFGEVYWLTGAVEGALKVTNGKVYSRNVTGEIPADLGPSVNGQSLDSLLADVRSLVSSR